MQEGAQFYFLCKMYHIGVKCFIDRKESIWGSFKEGVEVMGLKAAIAAIGEKYGLEINGESYQDKIKRSIVEILNRIPQDKKIVIRGGGEHTRQLLSLEGCTADFKYIFDNSRQVKGIVEISGKEWEVYPDSAMDEMDVDVVIISSYAHRKEMRGQLRRKKKEFMVLDLYDELQKEGLNVNAPFYYIVEDTYENVIYYRTQYFADKNASNLKNLIVAYLKIFDFINFDKFSKEYISNEYVDYQNIQMALDEMKELLNNVKTHLQKRRYRDIIAIWNDQVGYSDLQYTTYMKEASKSSMFFENAYAMTPFTVPALLEMFQGLKSIDDGIYHKPFPVANKYSSRMIRKLELAGYEFVYIGDEADANLFEKNNVMASYTYNSSCARCIDLLQKLLDTDKPVYVILHTLVETHNPYLSGELDRAKWYEWPSFGGDSEETALEQMKESLAYWDKQLAYYMEFMPECCVRIFMSDHGKRYNYQPIYKEPTTHVVLFVQGNGVPYKRCKKMFSLYDFSKLIDCIIKNEYREEEMFSDYVLMQETNIFNRAAIRYYIENNAKECLCGWRAVRTERELYVKLSSGKKYYYLLPDEETDCIELADKERVAWLDKLAGDKFEDTSEYEKELAFFRKQFETHE